MGAPSATAVVVGAGIFGVCVADALEARGVEVTLVEAATPGHDQASSGGHSRVIRAGHGDARGDLYLHSARRAWTLWRQLEERLDTPILHPVGATWLAATLNGPERAAYDRLSTLGVPATWLTPEELRAADPRVAVDGLAGALHEHEAGVLRAAPAVDALTADLQRRGVRLLRGIAEPTADGHALLDRATTPDRATTANRATTPADRATTANRATTPTDRAIPADRVTTANGAATPTDRTTPERRPVADRRRRLQPLAADITVWATGAWLGRQFPELAPVRAARREYVYVAPPSDWQPDAPVLVDVAAGVYVLPDVHGAGVKIADDLGPHALDLDAPERPADPDVEARLRSYTRTRMPSLATARRLGGRVCAYELTPDDHFLVGRHPAAPDVWLVGGGSGHGFKHGPALGHDLAGWILGDGEPPARWRLGPRTADGATLRASGSDA